MLLTVPRRCQHKMSWTSFILVVHKCAMAKRGVASLTKTFDRKNRRFTNSELFKTPPPSVTSMAKVVRPPILSINQTSTPFLKEAWQTRLTAK